MPVSYRSDRQVHGDHLLHQALDQGKVDLRLGRVEQPAGTR
jgi:hypothetical protein